MTGDAMLREIGRVGGYAPGNYMGNCGDCKREFIGDKRAISCLPCAVRSLQKAMQETAPTLARAEFYRGLKEGSDFKAWVNDRTIGDRVEAAIINARYRGAKIKAGSTTEEAIRTAFTEIVRDAMLWAKDEALSSVSTDVRGEETALAVDDEAQQAPSQPDTSN